MKKTPNRSLCSSSVIATALLLGATPGFAQSAQPSVSPFPEVAAPAPLPETSTTTAPDPVITPGPVTTSDPVMISSPVVQPIPEPEAQAESEAPTRNEPAAAPARTQSTEVRTPRPAAVPEPAAAAPEPAPAAELPSAPVEVVPFEIGEPVPVTDEAAAPVADNELAEDLLPIALGGLGVLALAIWGFVAIGRRKPLQRRAETTVRPAPKPVERSQPALAASPVVTRSWSPNHTTTPAPSMAHSGAGVALPRRMPASFEERDALLKRMVAAKPDRANPFLSYKARMKRARLIVQSLDRDFSDAEPWIDLSQYSANWPELTRSKTAAA